MSEPFTRSEEEDSFFVSKVSMKFEKILPNYEKTIEVYSNESEEMLDENFASTIKIKSLKQIGSGGQATVFKS